MRGCSVCFSCEQWRGLNIELRSHLISFGLGLDAYLHFTSPIRRYPDLVVHRLVKRFPVENNTDVPDELPEIARHVSRRERLILMPSVMVSVYKALYMRERVATS